MHVQSCCFANLKLLLFCRSRFHRCRRCLSSLLSNHVRRKQPSGPIKSQSKNVCRLFFSLACDVIAFLFFAFYSFLGGQFMASNGWTLIPIYLTVSKFSTLYQSHDTGERTRQKMLPMANRMTENIYPGENYHLQRRRHARVPVVLN